MRIFAPDNRTIAKGGGSARVWAFPIQTGAGEDLTRLAEVLAGYRLDASMTAAPLTAQDLERNVDQLTKSHPSWFSVTPQKEAQWEPSAAEWLLSAGRPRDAVLHFDRLVDLEAVARNGMGRTRPHARGAWPVE